MSAETGRHRRLEIAHVLFVDIVGYSKLLLNEQSEILDELNEVVRSAEQVRVAQDAGALLRLPTGDGVALIFRGSPEAPAQCALEVARILKSHPKLQLRMGIHSGPVNEATSAEKAAKCAHFRFTDCARCNRSRFFSRARSTAAPSDRNANGRKRYRGSSI